MVCIIRYGHTGTVFSSGPGAVLITVSVYVCMQIYVCVHAYVLYSVYLHRTNQGYQVGNLLQCY